MTTRGTYSSYDFSETLNHVDSPISKADVKSVLYAYGYSIEGFGEWQGGFVMRLNDGRLVMLTGWCDTSGWGCQDGITFSELPEGTLTGWSKFTNEHGTPVLAEWDVDPIDLNRYVRGEISDFDTEDLS